MYVTFKVPYLRDSKDTLDEAIEQAISRLKDSGDRGSDVVYVLKVVKKVERHFPVHITDVE